MVTVGNFDGVHRGHQALVAAAVSRAREASGGRAVALTFDPHPARVLQPERAPRSLMTSSTRPSAWPRSGSTCWRCSPFTRDLAAETPEGFARGVLAGTLGARAVVVGEELPVREGARGRRRRCCGVSASAWGSRSWRCPR